MARGRTIDRDAVRRAYRPDEEQVVAERLDAGAAEPRPRSAIRGAMARSLVKAVRAPQADRHRRLHAGL